MSEPLDRVRTFFDRLYSTQIQRNNDRIIPVVGPEGAGKSTFILEAMWLYDKVRDQEPDPATTLSYVVFDDRDAFRDKLLSANETDPISVMDAAHVLYNKDVMQPDQIKTEKSLLDIRIENYVIFLGYQDWGDIPRTLRKRRAGNAFRIPERGYVEGYSRSQLDEKYNDLDDNEWPEPSLRDRFPSLEGTKLWERFEDIDAERKRARLRDDDEDEEDQVTPQDVVDQIVADDNLAEYVEVNEFQNRAYYSKPLLRYDFPELSDQQADQVRSALAREADPEVLAAETTETDTQTPHAEG